MSFRVNTNVAAMGVLRNVSMTGLDFNKSITKLSTGMRINSAGDDPAGLIVSESFRAQIAGVSQAVRNNQDAINYAKTAEGALDEVNRLLRDARALAVQSANSGTLDASQIQASQAQLASILTSIDRISTSTQYGTKKLLDGSAGIVAGPTSSNVTSLYLSGQFNAASLTTNSSITMSVTTAAEQANVATAAFADANTNLQATGNFTINGVIFAVNNGDTVGQLVNRINSQTSSTGVQATFTDGGAITLSTVGYGSKTRIDVADTDGIVLAAPGVVSDSGVDAVADVIVDTNGSTAGGLATVTFTGGRLGYDGLMLSDSDGNSIRLTPSGNQSSGAFLAGYLSAGNATFQIGGNAGQTVSLSIGNISSTQLGIGAVSGQTLADLDVTNASNATDAMKIIDQAISDVARRRGEIGNFQRNVLDTNIRSLGVAKESLTAAESMIRDVDIAEEMTQFTRLQILTQSGMAVLAQANSAPQQVLSLLRG